MSAHPLRLASTVARDVRWDWLAPAVRMAAAGHGVHPLAADRAALEWTCFPRVATRTPNGTAQSVGAARDFGLATMRRWTVADRTDDISIVLSELLTNALRHGAEQPARPVRVALVQPAQFVLVVVSDPGPAGAGPTGAGLPGREWPRAARDQRAERHLGLHHADRHGQGGLGPVRGPLHPATAGPGLASFAPAGSGGRDGGFVSALKHF